MDASVTAVGLFLFANLIGLLLGLWLCFAKSKKSKGPVLIRSIASASIDPISFVYSLLLVGLLLLAFEVDPCLGSLFRISRLLVFSRRSLPLLLLLLWLVLLFGHRSLLHSRLVLVGGQNEQHGLLLPLAQLSLGLLPEFR